LSTIPIASIGTPSSADGQVVHFDVDSGFFTHFCRSDFATDFRLEELSEIEGCCKEVCQFRSTIGPLKELEHFIGVLAEFRVRGEQQVIGKNTGAVFVEVAGANGGVVTIMPVLTTRNQYKFRVNF